MHLHAGPGPAPRGKNTGTLQISGLGQFLVGLVHAVDFTSAINSIQPLVRLFTITQLSIVSAHHFVRCSWWVLVVGGWVVGGWVGSGCIQENVENGTLQTASCIECQKMPSRSIISCHSKRPPPEFYDSPVLIEYNLQCLNSATTTASMQQLFGVAHNKLGHFKSPTFCNISCG